MFELRNISKSYGGVHALKDVSMTAEPGKIHALLGENGAGKSTLMKILSGAVQKDSGAIYIDGIERDLSSPKKAKNEGISIIYQEFSLVPELTVAENIYLNQLGETFWINWNELYKKADGVVKSLGFSLDVKRKVASLSVAEQQIVEIAKALVSELKLLILDEPSDVLGPREVRILYQTLEKLKERGVAIIYISHHLQEILEISDSVTVLRDGKAVSTVKNEGLTGDKLIAMMLGKVLNRPKRTTPALSSEAKVFRVSGIGLSPSFTEIAFEVRTGEILGIAGLVGSGRTELLRAIFGADTMPKKQLYFNHRSFNSTTPKKSVEWGIAMVPEDRKKQGGFLTQSLRNNISIARFDEVANRLGFIHKAKETSRVTGLTDRLKVKCASIDAPLGSLSGGNQQKVILAKWMNSGADIFLIDEPTRGVDVGARSQIYDILFELADSGKVLIIVSSDLEELITIADRIVVMKNGSIRGEVGKDDFSEEQLLRLAIEEKEI
ncbi:MAG TPA: sugar ABC transporter ATP-binding protein [Arachidicoccus sp.]|nr:sugar ABC transporter ATP-binding protein [Arachidicoccus sp.]